MSPIRISRCLVPVALVSLLAAGCSELPTQPVVDQASPEANSLRSGPSSMARLQAPPPTDNPLSALSTKRIKGNNGGMVTDGMFTAVIPPGAFSGWATVSIRQPDPTQPVAVIEISPASKNNFHVPVLLIARLPGVGSLLMETGMSEFDQASDAWLAMNGEQPDTQAMTLTTPLMHFSTYRVEVPTGATGSGAAGGSGGPLNQQPKIVE